MRLISIQSTETMVLMLLKVHQIRYVVNALLIISINSRWTAMNLTDQWKWVKLDKISCSFVNIKKPKILF